jgi:hypothetical protein
LYLKNTSLEKVNLDIEMDFTKKENSFKNV